MTTPIQNPGSFPISPRPPAMASQGVTFPLSDHYLPKVSLTPQEMHEYRKCAREIVAKTLEQEMEYRYTHKCKLDERKWKFLKAKNCLQVYKRLPHNVRQSQSSTTSFSSRMSRDSLSSRSRADSIASVSSLASPPPIPMVLAVGKIEGQMEDALYGVHHKNTDEMRITTSFVNMRLLDAAVLHTIDTGTDEDPYRYLGIKWRIAETPGGNLICNRDVCALEFTGTGMDTLGHKYGFHVIKSIDAPWFPELPDTKIMRARMMLCVLYRQLQPTAVDTYMKGVFNLGGDLIDMIAYNTAADKLLAIAKTVDCAEAKKLTLRMILEQQRRIKSFGGRTGSRATCSADFSVDRSATTADDEDGNEDAFAAEFGADDVCSVCHKTRSALSKIGSKWDRCRICRGSACSKCHVRKTVFARPKHIKVACCKVCIMAAKELSVDPRDPYPVIGTMMH